VCLAGGVALNGLTNGKIIEKTKFKNVHVTYAPGDGGTAIGAAMWDFVKKREASEKIIRFENGPFCGRKYSNNEYELAIASNKLSSKQPKKIFHFIASQIAIGKTVAWFEGGCEFGPRALGHRSILSDPRNPQMLNHINHKIKNREWFRPVAPAVIEPSVQKYFKADCYSPYMQFVWQVNEAYKKELPAITHIDGSSRIQSVKRNGNESLYELLLAFAELTGFPILINTSFNIHGEPIVETPNQAIASYMKSAIDILVLGEYVIQK
jgi:carbamoyltransferase